MKFSSKTSFFHFIYIKTLQKGAFLNDMKISPSNTDTLSESLLATGFPYEHDEKYDTSFKIFKDFFAVFKIASFCDLILTK